MLNTLQRDILKRHIGPFLFSLVTILFLLLLQFLILHIDKLVGKGLDPWIVLELISYQLAYMLVLAVPMSVLVATLMAYGRFSELSELTATKAAGVTPLQLMKPVLFTAVLLGVFLAWFSNSVLPEANFKARSLFLDIRMKKPGFDLQSNIFYDGIEGYTFLVRDLSAQADTMFNVTIYQDATPTRDRAIIKAELGILSSDERNYALILDLFNGSVHRALPDSRNTTTRYEESLFERQRIRFDLSDMAFSRTNPNVRRRDDRTMSAQAMQVVVDSLRREINNEIERLIDHTQAVRLLELGPGHRPLREIQSIQTIFDPDSTITNPSEYDGPYRALRFLADHDSRQIVLRDAINGMRGTQSKITGVNTNTEWREERIAQFRVEIIKKIAIPFGCIIFVLIGAPLGMLTRKGNLGVNVVISAVLFTYYWITIIQGEKLADRLIIAPFTGMWFGNITLGILGIILLIRVTSERRISDLWRRS
ncbi:MAG: LptF/LptG family permease [Balneolales bacterium]|nr:LptF/LptG family permease [Balneolales bacterium]